MLGQGRLVERGATPATGAVSASWLDGRIIFDQRRWRCSEAELNWVAPAHLIVATCHGGTRRTKVTAGGARPHEGADRPGMVSIVPAGTPRHGIYEGADLVYAALWIDPELAFPGSGLPLQGGARTNAQDPLLPAVLASLRADLAAGFSHDALYVEHLALLCLKRAGLIEAPPPPTTYARLSPVTLRRIEEYIDAHIGGTITLGALASVAGIGTDSFARRFKATTGLAPYAFVLELRMQRAEAELARSNLPIANLAARLGFASQSHFTAAFRRRRGTTPQAYRAAFS
ncbi:MULTISPECIES: helix-turn-helix transcriptional regulator [unclassified Bosea (in: a-proteobacteria)]|uniref:helix-turn-helix transcriptional regulator n=1 Tax=unclassified Bosea (in: a-proteobacteria) TaxID=2653178 RepID=UPI0013E98ED8|nr:MULTISPECIES: AraC family transcriptional regulator [unclassified Bosea (in: a-proteobacteria)]